jgi:hypothetical protein
MFAAFSAAKITRWSAMSAGVVSDSASNQTSKYSVQLSVATAAAKGFVTSIKGI